MLNYLYYRLFKFFELTEKHLTPNGIRMPEYLAMFAVILLVSLNLFAINSFLYEKFRLQLLFSSKGVAFGLLAVILLSGYLLFIHKGKYKLIVEKYNQENTRMRYISIAFTIIYIVFSFLLLVLATS